MIYFCSNLLPPFSFPVNNLDLIVLILCNPLTIPVLLIILICPQSELWRIMLLFRNQRSANFSEMILIHHLIPDCVWQEMD